MKATFFLAGLLAALPIMATPIEDVSAKRDSIKIYLCKKKGASSKDSNCRDFISNSGDCIDLDVHEDGKWGDDVSSLDTYGHKCMFYKDQGCANTGQEVLTTTGQTTDLGQEWEDVISSYKCE